MYLSCAYAGFPSPADDYLDIPLNLHDYLIKRPSSTFCVRVRGESMQDIGIYNNDILVVDRSIEATHGKIVIAAFNNELTVKRLHLRNSVIKLLPENPDYPEIVINEDIEIVIWGVVTNVIHELD